MSWPFSDIEQDDSPPKPSAVRDQQLSDQDLLELHDLLALSKFIPLSTILLKNIMSSDTEASQVFDVSHKERQIIDHPSSSFVIGRSGSGKTTCMIFRMFGIQKAFDRLRERGSIPKSTTKIGQLFITQSR